MNYKAIVIVFVLISSIALPIKQVSADIESGTQCVAANLAQALSLGLGYSQLGVKNNGSRAFFIACPISAPVLAAVTGYSMEVNFPTGGGNMTCVVRSQRTGNQPTFFTRIINISTSNKFKRASGTLTPFLDFATEGNHTMVCPLQPGESISWYVFG